MMMMKPTHFSPSPIDCSIIEEEKRFWKSARTTMTAAAAAAAAVAMGFLPICVHMVFIDGY